MGVSHPTPTAQTPCFNPTRWTPMCPQGSPPQTSPWLPTSRALFSSLKSHNTWLIPLLGSHLTWPCPLSLCTQLDCTVPPWIKSLFISFLLPPAPSMGFELSRPSVNTYWIVYFTLLMYLQGLWFLALKSPRPPMHPCPTAIYLRTARPPHPLRHFILLPSVLPGFSWRKVSWISIQILENSCLIL